MTGQPRDGTIRLRDMVRTGAGCLRRYLRLAVTLYAVQLAIATGAAFVMARMLAAAFARYPIFDEAVDGGAFALALVVLRNSDLFANLAWVAFGAITLYAIVSWFLVGGLIAVYVAQPASRSAPAFGAGGARSFFSFARLALWCLIPYGIGAIAMAIGLASAGDDLLYALTFTDFLAKLFMVLAPGAAVFWLSFAAVDYARVDLVRYPDQSSLRALLRGYRMVVSGWRPMVHVTCYYVAVGGVSAVYVAATFDQPLGALVLLLVRQLVSMARFAAKLVLIGGQTSLAGHMRPPVPRPRRRARRQSAAQSAATA